MARPAPVIVPDDPSLLAAHLMKAASDPRGRRTAARALLRDLEQAWDQRQGRQTGVAGPMTLSHALAHLDRGDRGVGAFNDDTFLEALEISVQEIRRHLRRLSQLAQRQSQENAA